MKYSLLGHSCGGVCLDTYDGFMPEENKPSPRFLTIDQVATELNIGQPLVRGLLKSGELRGFQLGGRGLWRIGLQDIEDYIADAYRRTAERIAAGELIDEGESDGE